MTSGFGQYQQNDYAITNKVKNKMKITAFTIFLFMVSFFSIWRILVGLKRDTIGIRSAVIWIVVWFGISFFSIFPQVAEVVMKLTPMKNRMFFILLLGVLVLFALLFHLDSRLDVIRREIAKLTRNLAILDFEVRNIKESKDDESEL